MDTVRLSVDDAVCLSSGWFLAFILIRRLWFTSINVYCTLYYYRPVRVSIELFGYSAYYSVNRWRHSTVQLCDRPRPRPLLTALLFILILRWPLKTSYVSVNENRSISSISAVPDRFMNDNTSSICAQKKRAENTESVGLCITTNPTIISDIWHITNE